MASQLQCEITGHPFEVSDTERAYCEREGLPLPRLSPVERWREMLIFRNRRHLFRTKCALSGRPILTAIPPQSGFTIVDAGVWEGDEWEATDFGREYDFSRGFFEQFFELARLVPLPSLAGAGSTRENSDFVNGVSRAKNCYLVFGGFDIEDCLYGHGVQLSRNLIDTTAASDCELCYSCSDIRGCYNLQFAQHCVGCSDSTFMFNCQSCRNCYGCVNLFHKEYCIWNEQLTPEEYRRRRAAISLSSQAALTEQRTRFDAFRKQFPLRAYNGARNEGSSGNFLYDTKNAVNCLNCNKGEDLEHCFQLGADTKSSLFFLCFGSQSEQVYNSVSCGLDVQRLRFCEGIRVNCAELDYCMSCSYGVQECFGSIGLKRKRYCILNREYSKGEYYELKERIISQMRARGEWGSSFPSRFSPHFYNRSDAIDVLPLPRAEALARGFRWDDEEQTAATGDFAVLPDDVSMAADTILSQVFLCRDTGRPYKLLPAELAYLRREGIALPTKSPMRRLEERAGFSRYRPLERMNCCDCSSPILTPYSHEGSAVLCEGCFAERYFS